MVGFLNSAVLFGLAAAAVPILIHLFARQRRKRILFSSISLLTRLETRRMQRLRLLSNVLLALRILAVLFIVLAFARPVIRAYSFFHAGEAGAAQILILDRSASMGRGDLFEEARTRALAWAGAIESGDEASLLFMDDAGPDPVWRRGATPLHQDISQAAAMPVHGDLTPLIPQIQDLLKRTRQMNKEIYLVSDFQSGGMGRGEDSLSQINEPVAVFAVPLAGPDGNIAVSGGIASQILHPGQAIRVYVVVRHFGKEAVDDLRIRVFLQGKAVARQSIRLAPGETRRVEFLVRPESGGPFDGSVVIDEDVLPWDNTFFFSGEVPGRLHVFLIGHTEADLKALSIALTALHGREGVFSITAFIPGQDWASMLREADAVFFSNYPYFSEREADALRRYFESGGGAVILPGPNMDIPSLQNRILGPLCRTEVRGASAAYTGTEAHWSLGRTDFQHPLLEDLFQNREPQIGSPRIFRRLELAGTGGLPVLAFRDGWPLLVETPAMDGRMLVFASGVHPEWSDWPYATLFAPLIYRAGLYLADRDAVQSDPVFAGGMLEVSLRPESLEGGFSVIDPEGGRIVLTPEIRDGRVFLALPTALPGVYRFFQGAREIALRAVNLDPRESDLRSLPPDSLRIFFPNSQIHVVGPGEALASAVRTARWGREFWRVMLICGVLLLISEMVLSRLLFRRARQGR